MNPRETTSYLALCEQGAPALLSESNIFQMNCHYIIEPVMGGVLPIPEMPQSIFLVVCVKYLFVFNVVNILSKHSFLDHNLMHTF